MTDENTEDNADYKSEAEKYKSKAAQAQNEAIDLRKKYKSFENLGKSPEEIQEIIVSAEKAENERATKAGEWEKLRDRLVSDYVKKLTDKDTQIDALTKSEHGAVVSSGLLKALSEAGATAEGIDLLPNILSGRAKIETVDGNRSVKIFEADGTEMIVGGKPATFKELSAQAVEKYPSLFAAQGKGGSGKQPGSGGAGSAKTMKMSDFNALPAKERAETMKSGTILTD